MSSQDDFNDMMRRMGVKPMDGAGARPTTRRRAKSSPSNAPASPVSKTSSADAENVALKATVADLETKLAEASEAHASATEQWDAERTKLTAEVTRLQEEMAANQLQQQVVRLCDNCPRLAGVMMVKVDGAACDACGGADLGRAVRRFLDACLINGRLRVTVVGRDMSTHALLRGLVQDRRLQLTQFPVDGKDAGRVAVDVTGQDAVVLWGAVSESDIRGNADRTVRIGPGCVADLLEAAGAAIAQDVSEP